MRPLILLMFLSSVLVTQTGNAKEESGTKYKFSHGQLKFNYQELNSPWASYSCKHEEDGPVDWKVYCLIDQGKVVKFAVHLIVNFYQKSTYGNSAYEVLYWVTDRTEPNRRTYDSTTMWIHNTEAKNRATRFEIGQGVLNDMVSLRLEISM
jgi:hypothetical protein